MIFSKDELDIILKRKNLEIILKKLSFKSNLELGNIFEYKNY